MAVHHFDGRELLRSLHYAAAFMFMGFFLSSVVACSCRSRSSHTPRYISACGQRSRLVLMLSLVFLYLTEGALDLLRMMKQHWCIPPHVVSYLLSSLLVWGWEVSQCMISGAARLRSLKGSSLIGLVAETAMAALMASDSQSAGDDAAIFGLHLGRATVLLALFLVSMCSTGKHCLEPDGEGNHLLPDGDSVATNYATISNANVGERSRETEETSAWNYIKSFAVFIPVLSPAGHPRIQVFYAVLGLQVVWTRIENILIPNQLGVVTRRLSESPNVPPWKDILIWVVLQWLSSNAGLNWIRAYARARVHIFSRSRFKKLVLCHIMDLSKDFHDTQQVGEILKAVEQGKGIDMLMEAIIFNMAPIILDIIGGLVYITYLFDFYVASIILTTSLAYCSLGVWLPKLNMSNRREYSEREREEASIAYESVERWQTVADFNRVDFQKNCYATAADCSVQAARRYWDMMNMAQAAITLTTVIGQTGAICLAVWRVAKGRNDLGNFVTLTTYWNQLLKPIRQLPSQYQGMMEQFADAERLVQLLQTKPSIISKEGAPSLDVIKGSIAFENVSFAYKEQLVLEDINFVAEPGQVVAFAGQTGGGKSTIFKLLSRYYDVSSGSIKIDSQDIKEVSLDSLRNSIGTVPQDPELFNNTIMYNLRYAHFEATDEEVCNACRAAAIHEKIMSLPNGYKTEVGRGGVMLSGGEKQRIAIARLLLRRPKIILLDEATSAVDNTTEQDIQKALKQLSIDRTTFVIAHRLSTIANADLILVIHEGRIVERGTHSVLINAGGKYAELWRV